MPGLSFKKTGSRHNGSQFFLRMVLRVRSEISPRGDTAGFAGYTISASLAGLCPAELVVMIQRLPCKRGIPSARPNHVCFKKSSMLRPPAST